MEFPFAPLAGDVAFDFIETLLAFGVAGFGLVFGRFETDLEAIGVLPTVAFVWPGGDVLLPVARELAALPNEDVAVSSANELRGLVILAS